MLSIYTRKYIIIECVVVLLTAVKSGKALLYVVILLRRDKPDTFNELLIVVALFNMVKPDIFNCDKHNILFVVNTPDIVLSPDVNAAAVIPDHPCQPPALYI